MPTPVALARSGQSVRLTFPGEVVVELDFGDPLRGGVTVVTAAGVPLREASHPLCPAVCTETGLVFDAYTLRDAQVVGDEAVVTLAASARVDYYQEKPDAYNQAISTEILEAPVTGTLRWCFRAHEATIRGESFAGFGYRFEFDSPEATVHHLLDRQTWEIGGAAEGNTTINRGGYIKPEHTATLDSRHTTSEEFKRVGRRYFTYMQLRPRFAYVQCFDYQTGPRGSLLMYFEDPTPNLILSLLHKERGRNLCQAADVRVPGLLRQRQHGGGGASGQPHPAPGAGGPRKAAGRAGRGALHAHAGAGDEGVRGGAAGDLWVGRSLRPVGQPGAEVHGLAAPQVAAGRACA